MEANLKKLILDNESQETLIRVSAGIGFDYGYTKGVQEKLYKLIQENLELRNKITKFENETAKLRRSNVELEVDKDKAEALNYYYKKRVITNREFERKINQLKNEIKKLSE